MPQKKRATKVSKGVNGGGGKTTLSRLQKVLISRTYSERHGDRVRQSIAKAQGPARKAAR